MVIKYFLFFLRYFWMLIFFNYTVIKRNVIITYTMFGSYLIYTTIGHHNKYLALQPFYVSLRYQHILWPSAATKVERFSGGWIVSWSVLVQVPVSRFVWYGHRRIETSSTDFVSSPLYCKIKKSNTSNGQLKRLTSMILRIYKWKHLMSKWNFNPFYTHKPFIIYFNKQELYTISVIKLNNYITFT